MQGNGGAIKKIQNTILWNTFKDNITNKVTSTSIKINKMAELLLKQLLGPRSLTSQVENKNLSVRCKKMPYPYLKYFVGMFCTST